MSDVSIEQVRAAASEIGAAVNYEPQFGLLDAWTPDGMVFSCNSRHCVTHHFLKGHLYQQKLADLLSDIEFGIEPCDDEDCEICTGEVAES